ncbi:hypothetical protein DL771_003452 [Monosporascus sp. 5C6A]|nr:hypothetical protein DL771_003452 [Monosporascus sp. 5C6A]
MTLAMGAQDFRAPSGPMPAQTLLGIRSTHGNRQPRAFTTKNQLPQPLIRLGQKHGAIPMMHTKWHIRSKEKDIEQERRVQECTELLPDIFPSKKTPDADEGFMYKYQDASEEDSIQAAKGICCPKDLDDTVSGADMSDLTYERGQGWPSSQGTKDAHKLRAREAVSMFRTLGRSYEYDYSSWSE